MQGVQCNRQQNCIVLRQKEPRSITVRLPEKQIAKKPNLKPVLSRHIQRIFMCQQMPNDVMTTVWWIEGKPLLELESWARTTLQDPNKQDQVMFIQETGAREKCFLSDICWLKKKCIYIQFGQLRWHEILGHLSQILKIIELAAKADFLAARIKGWHRLNTWFLFCWMDLMNC